MSQIYFLNTAIGGLKLEAENGLLQHISHVRKVTTKQLAGNDSIPSGSDKRILQKTAKQLQQFFAGKRKEFDLALNWQQGTEFQQQVWRALQTIPYGQTISYKQLAEKINNPKAVRAVGGANNKNPFSIIVPCHRVIGANGALVGYGGGLDRKQILLDLES